ncbi:MAG: metallophosphoesterase [Phycisphaerae bacterium]|jgi:metallophosphoesterase (TIGR00282 family)|nr:MAG: metallophosphoesterase [Phycisphaerae bacterium]
MTVRILVLGDIVGRPGRQVVHDQLPLLVRERKVDLVIANAENIAGGSGITTNLFNKLRSYGVDVCTLGDHALRKSDIIPTLNASERIIRPANFPSTAPGRRYTIVTTNSGVAVAVFTVMGRIFMNLPCDDPFAASDEVLREIGPQVKIRIIEVHAEATSEKVAMGHYLDGRASLIFGTHTHIPTADARILPGGSAYISDLGMCGPYDSVLGRRKDRVLQYMTTAIPSPFDIATGDVRLCGVFCEIDAQTGRSVSIERIEVRGHDDSPAYDADDRSGNREG